MPNKHFCQGPTCHEKPTTDRFLKSRGVIRGRYAYARARTVVPFISHRRESQGYHKVTDDSGYRRYNTIERVDNRTEID
jgi:hypothetical protein